SDEVFGTHNGTPIAYDSWCHLRKMLDWVALDRAIRLAQKRSLPLDRTHLAAERDRIYEAIMTRGWDTERQTFVQHFGTNAVDASNLIMPLVFFLSPTDPRMRGTLDRTMAELVSDSLVHRYEIGRAAGDGLTGSEGTFNMCTFWLVEALARGAAPRRPASSSRRC
ncbi:glycoside hydrolase family 15 protein, partial [Bradyrhizobium sp. Leo121]|uniref:glycoside hydrolase family 15 protein n=1 Tax=Bradyrhizobium sp. Leo121 TaxID=1571195 RepID=UPI001FE20389